MMIFPDDSNERLLEIAGSLARALQVLKHPIAEDAGAGLTAELAQMLQEWVPKLSADADMGWVLTHGVVLFAVRDGDSPDLNWIEACVDVTES